MYFSLLFLCIQAFSAFGMENNGLDFYQHQNSSDNKYIQKNYVENLYYVNQKEHENLTLSEMVAKNVEAGVQQGIQTAVATLVLHGIEYSVSSLLAGLKSTYHHFYPNEEYAKKQLNQQAELINHNYELITNLSKLMQHCSNAECIEIINKLKDEAFVNNAQYVNALVKSQKPLHMARYNSSKSESSSDLSENKAASPLVNKFMQRLHESRKKEDQATSDPAEESAENSCEKEISETQDAAAA